MKYGSNYRARAVHTIAAGIEQVAARIQGKGYSSSNLRREVKHLAKLLDSPPTLAVDCGAHIGNYTAELRRTYPDLEIHAFEPSSPNFDRLTDRFGNDRGVNLIPAAVAGRSGLATLFADTNDSVLGSLSKRRLEHFGIKFSPQEEVELIRLEDYWRSNLHERQIDIIKLDIEGLELEALGGAGAALSSTKCVQFEFGGCNIDSRTFFQDFWYLFCDLGFTLFRLTPIGLQRISQYRESQEFYSTTNYFALNHVSYR